jgi:hypothetical protein
MSLADRALFLLLLAATSPVNTYGPGLKKQRACVPCPTGFTTDLRVQQTMPTACIVPAGYYLKAPGQVGCPSIFWDFKDTC